MYTHARRHLNIPIGCSWLGCEKTYNAPDSLNKHIKKMHVGVLAPSAIIKEEAEAVISGLIESK